MIYIASTLLYIKCEDTPSHAVTIPRNIRALTLSLSPVFLSLLRVNLPLWPLNNKPQIDHKPTNQTNHLMT